MSSRGKPRKTTFTLALAMTLSGCAEMGKHGDTKSEQFSMQGCLVGGAAAGLLTYLINAGDEGAREKAIIATAIGCMAGAVIGFKIGERTEEYANATQAATAETARNKDTADRLHQYNASLEVNINDYERQIQNVKNASLTAQERQESFNKTKEIVSKQRKKAKEALSETEQELNLTKKQYTKYRKSLDTAEANGWQEQLASLEQEKLILGQYVNRLNALDASI